MRVIFANDALGTILGQERLFLMGKYLGELLPFLAVENGNVSPPQVTKLNGVYKTVFNQKPLIIEIVAAHLYNVQEIVLVLRDITEEKMKEKVLLERTEEMERMNKLMLGRELKMVELKEELARLKGATQ
jgi:hypothetical protein